MSISTTTTFENVLAVLASHSADGARLRENQSLAALAMVQGEQCTVLDVLAFSHTCKTMHRVFAPIMRDLYEHVCGKTPLPVSNAASSYRFAVSYAQFMRCARCSHNEPTKNALPYRMRLCERCVYQTGLSHGVYDAHPSMPFKAMLPGVARLVRIGDAVNSALSELNTRGKMAQAVASTRNVRRYLRNGTPDDENGDYYWLPDLLVAALSRGNSQEDLRAPLKAFNPYSAQQQYMSKLSRDDLTPKQIKRRADADLLRADLCKRAKIQRRRPLSSDGDTALRRSTPPDALQTRRRLMFHRARSLAFYDNSDAT